MFITIVATLLVLGLVIFIHELGHFAVAKRSGIRVEQFSLGFPPKMIGKKIGETEYCISWLPLGGYVKIAGQSDLGEAEIKGEPWEFASKPIFTKIAVIAAGPLMNFLLAFFIFSALTLGWGIPAYNTTRIGEVLENSPAEAVGIEVGDRIISIEDQRVQNWAQIQRAITLNRGKTFQIKLERGNEVKTLVVTLQPEDEILGISPFIEPVVGRVEKGSPAQRAGIRQGDVITAINGKQVTQWRDVVDEIYSHPGESITVEWRRDGEYYKDTVITQMKKQYDAQNRVVEYGAIGISAGFTTKKVGPLQAIHYGIKQTWERTYL
ncbi:MAG: RIP metalloprotease RseP, partial [Candidatus Latescibacteria bacterium 4484_181]